MADDRYANFDYRRLIAWDERLKREWPLFDELLRSAPSKRVLDLGSGTGDHSRLFASEGYEVVGVDASDGMLEKARQAAPDIRYVKGDMREVDNVIDGQFGAAICVGNALPHLTGERDIERLAAGLRKVVLPGGPFLLQMINYDRIEQKNERALPLSFLKDPDDAKATIVFMRTMELLPDGRVIFMPTSLRQRSDLDPPIEVVTSHRVEIRGWRKPQIESAFRAGGFTSFEFLGSYQKAPFDAGESRDLIMIAR